MLQNPNFTGWLSGVDYSDDGTLQILTGKDNSSGMELGFLQFHIPFARKGCTYRDKACYVLPLSKEPPSEVIEELFFSQEDFETHTSVSLPDEAKNASYLLVHHSRSETILFFKVINLRDNSKVFLKGTIEVVPTSLFGENNSSRSLQSKTVFLVGTGSGGGFASALLASVGVGTLHLFDGERLTSDNIQRHICDINEVGRSKVQAVADYIREHRFLTKVVPHRIDILSDADSFRKALNEIKPHIIVGCTDDILSRQYLNYCAVRLNIPLVLGCVFDAGRIGEIIAVIPGVTACYECVRDWLMQNGSLSEAEEGREYGEPYAPQSPSDSHVSNPFARVSLVATLQVWVTIALLRNNGQSLGDFPTSYMICACEKHQAFSEPFTFELPFSIKYVPIRRNVARCNVCGSLTKSLKANASNEMVQEILARFEKQERIVPSASD